MYDTHLTLKRRLYLDCVGTKLAGLRFKLLLLLFNIWFRLRSQIIGDDVVSKGGNPILRHGGQTLVPLLVQEQGQGNIIPQQRRFVVLYDFEQRIQLKHKIMTLTS